MRRVGVLIFGRGTDPLSRQYAAALRISLEKHRWIDGRNLKIDLRFGRGNVETTRAYAADLVSLRPDAILGQGGPVTRALQQQTRSIPIVFVAAGDVIALGIVKSLSHPEAKEHCSQRFSIGSMLEPRDLSPSAAEAALRRGSAVPRSNADCWLLLRAAFEVQKPQKEPKIIGNVRRSL